MKIYLAGACYTSAIEYIFRKGGHKLWSPLHNLTGIRKSPPTADVMIDSGAHSWNKTTINKTGIAATKNLPDIKNHLNNYLKLIDQYKNTNWVFVELDAYAFFPLKYLDDVYKDVQKIKGTFKYIRVYHKILDNGTLRVMKKWIDDGQTYIGIGRENQDIFGNVFKITRDKIKLHCFAFTGLKGLKTYPFYSVDSTTWRMYALFGGNYNSKKMRYESKSKIYTNKNLSVVKSKIARERENIDGVMKTEKFITELWAKRGVIWDE